MINDAEFADISDRCSKAQRGPWMVAITERRQLLIITHIETAIASTPSRLPDEFRQRLDEFPNLQDDYGYVKPGVATDVCEDEIATMEFIAHSRMDMPRLLEEIHLLKEENAKLKEGRKAKPEKQQELL
jgi:hypothetical protein